MKRRSVLNIAAAAALGLGLLPGSVIAQQKSLKDQLVGTWTLVSWDQTLRDGTKNQRFGSNPKGVNTYSADGHFTLIILRPDLPKIASGDPEKPTPEEAHALARGSIAYYGTYTVDEPSKMVTLHLDGTTLANQMGMDQKRVVTSISDSEMKYGNPVSVTGGKIELAWKRAQ